MAGANKDVTVRMKKCMLSWFGHVERMSDERMAKNIYDGKVNGKRSRGRPVEFCKYSIKDTGGRSHKKYEDSPKLKDVYENAETITFGTLFSLTTH